MMKMNKILMFVAGLGLIIVTLGKGWAAADDKGQPAKYVTKNNVQYETLSFETLSSFRYPMPDLDYMEGGDEAVAKDKKEMKSKKNLIPDKIRALSGKKVALTGFIMPVDNEAEGHPNFLLIDQIVTCMFCQMIRINEWVYVVMKDTKPLRIKDSQYDQPFTIYGELTVGEHYEDGNLVSIYEMQADSIQVEKNKSFLSGLNRFLFG